MTFDEIATEVYGWTKRPDMTTQTESAIRAATLKYHRKEKFWRDVVTVVKSGLVSAVVQQIDISVDLPRFRQLAYIKVTDVDKYLSIVNTDDLLDPDGIAKNNIAYGAGTSLNLKSTTPLTSVDICYWQDPVVWPKVSYSSWIANTQPDLIIASAAAKIFAFDSESEIYRAAIAEEAVQWLELMQNNTEFQGR